MAVCSQRTVTAGPGLLNKKVNCERPFKNVLVGGRC